MRYSPTHSEVLVRLLPLFWLAACSGDVGLAQNAVCDGTAQPGEDSVDAPFDADEDGYFDGGNPDCAATYAADRLDCDDSDPDVNPGAEEICDGVDNNCDGEIDEDCASYSGTWVVVPSISYACALNAVTLSVSSLTITDAGDNLVVEASGGTQPGAMSGSFADPASFSVTNTISSGGAGCDETYTLTGTFTDEDTLTGTLSTTFVPNGFLACADCQDRTWPVTATR